MVKNPAPVGFAIEILQNPAGFGKSKSGTTLFVRQNMRKTKTSSSFRLFESEQTVQIKLTDTLEKCAIF